MSTERDELHPMRELDAHRPTYREYEGGWWELACAGCDFAKGERLSHLDWAPHDAHREEIFRAAILAGGYRRPQQVTTVEELDALPVGSTVFWAEEAWLRAKAGDSVWKDFNGQFWTLIVTEDEPAMVLHVGGAE